MATGRLTVASQVLQRQNADLVTAVSAADLVNLTLKLYGDGLIERETKDDVCLLAHTPLQKACIVVSAVERKVEADPSLFHQFTTLLQNEGDSTLRSLGKKLHETCTEIERHIITQMPHKTLPVASLSPLVPHHQSHSHQPPVPSCNQTSHSGVSLSHTQVTHSQSVATPSVHPSYSHQQLAARDHTSLLTPICNTNFYQQEQPAFHQHSSSNGHSVPITPSQSPVSHLTTPMVSPLVHQQQSQSHQPPGHSYSQTSHSHTPPHFMCNQSTPGDHSYSQPQLVSHAYPTLSPHNQQLFTSYQQPPFSGRESLPVSQPQSPLHLSQPPTKRICSPSFEQSTALGFYADYLRAVYTRSKLPNSAATTWPPNPSKKYINVAVISKGGVGTTREEADELRREAVHGRIGHILKKKRPIRIEEILQGEELKCILVEGAPGIGKSTLAGEICRRWGKRECFQEYSVVVLLILRNETVQGATVVADLFHHDDESIRKQVSKEILQCHGSNVLIILEGLDELPERLLTTHTIFTSILAGTILPQATILVTSRPAAIWQEFWHVSYHVEILGFSEDNIREYIESVLPAEELPGFDSYLSMHPHIKSMLYVPLHCAIATVVYLQCQQSRKPPPKTLTGLYTSLAQIILLRYLKKEEHPNYEAKKHSIENFTDLPCPVYEHFRRLCEIAFNGVDKQKLIFHDIPQPFEHLGFMDAVPELFLHCDSANFSYNFLHLSVQEYLAAYHISLLSHCEQEQLLQTVRYGDHRFNMTRFLAGITQFKGLDEQTIKNVIGISDSAMQPVKMSDYTLEFLYECQDVSILDSEHCYSVSIENSKYGLMALGYAVSRSGSKWNFIFNGIDGAYHLHVADGSYSIEDIRFVSCSSKFIETFLSQLPQHVLSHVKSFVSENAYPLPPLSSSVAQVIPKMEGLHTLKLDNTLPFSLNRLIALLPSYNPGLRILGVYDSGEIFGDGGKVPARLLPKLMSAVPELKSLSVISRSGSDYFKIQFPESFESGTIDIKCEVSAPVIFEQFLQQLPKQTISHIGTFIYHSGQLDEGEEEDVLRTQQLPSCLPELIPRMESLNTLTLKNVFDSSLGQLIAALSRVPTLRNLLVSNRKKKFDMEFNHSTGTIESTNFTPEFLNQLLPALPQQSITNIVSLTINSYEAELSIPPCLPELIAGMGRLNTLILRNVLHTSLIDLIPSLSRVPTLRTLSIDSDVALFECTIDVYSSSDRSLAQLQSYHVDVKCENYNTDVHGWEIFDHILLQLLPEETLAHIESFSYDCYGGGDYSLLPSLPKLVLRMGRLKVLTLKNVEKISLTELELSKIPTLRRLCYVSSNSNRFSCTISIDGSGHTPLPQLQPYHVDLEYTTFHYAVQELEIFDLILLQLLPEETLAHIESFSCDSKIMYGSCSYLLPSLPKLVLKMGRLKTLTLKHVDETCLTELVLPKVSTLRKLSIECINMERFDYIIKVDNPLPQLQCCCVDILYPGREYRYTGVFDHILELLLLSNNTVAHITSLKYNLSLKDNSKDIPMQPSLPRLILGMQRLNMLELAAKYDSTLAELVLAMSRVPTLKRLSVFSKGCGFSICSSSDNPLAQLQPHHVDLEYRDLGDSAEVMQLFEHFLLQFLPENSLTHIQSFNCSRGIEDAQLSQLPPYLPQLVPRMERLNLLILKSLTLPKLNSEDIALLFQWLSSCQLETLKLHYLSPDGVEMVSRCLTTVLSLKTLVICRLELTIQSMQAFVSMLQQKQLLLEVNCNDGSIDCDSVCCLAEALHHNTTLRKLDMSGNPVEERGALAMAEMLKQNTTLEKVYLYGTEINSNGTVAIAEALHHNTTLRKLDLSANPVEERGALAMAEMLKQNTTLEVLDFKTYDYDIEFDKAIKVLILNLAVNSHLKKIILNDGYKELVESHPTYHDHRERVEFH